MAAKERFPCRQITEQRILDFIHRPETQPQINTDTLGKIANLLLNSSTYGSLQYIFVAPPDNTPVILIVFSLDEMPSIIFALVPFDQTLCFALFL